MILLIKLILAHLTGDFLLQPDGWVKAKETKKLGAYQLYLHAIVHFAIIMLLVWDIRFWKQAILLAGFHLITDIIKLFAQHKNSRRFWFFADQLVHFVLIYLVWIWYQEERLHFPNLDTEYVLLLITFVYALTQPASAIIRSVISKWSPATVGNNEDSLDNAGKTIGILERLFVFAFVLTGNLEAIGFLLAAKSVFRFGDLKESKDRKLTEYVLIGTLLSFGIALLAGVVFLKLNMP
jgi:hypothetical protein